MLTLAIAVIAATIVQERSGSAGKAVVVALLICVMDVLFSYLMAERETRMKLEAEETKKEDE